MKIQVTQEDIDKGAHGSAKFCPIAIAVKRAVPEAFAASVIANVRYFTDDGSVFVHYIKHDSPEDRFISAFDGCEHVEPFEFEANFSQVR